MEVKDIDTANNQLVGVQGDLIRILNPVTAITKAEALCFAAWLIILADDNDEFGLYIEAVQST